jgi:MerR family transcriptional regulator/heat shock protein HspR
MTRRTELTTRTTTALTKTTGRGEAAYITVTVAARRCGVAPYTVRRYIRRGLVNETLAEAELAELRRIRRLTGLGVNLAGVEIILHMRRQIEELQAEMDRLHAFLDETSGINWRR